MTVGGREQQAPAVTVVPAGRGGATYAKWAAVVVAAGSATAGIGWRGLRSSSERDEVSGTSSLLSTAPVTAMAAKP